MCIPPHSLRLSATKPVFRSTARWLVGLLLLTVLLTTLLVLWGFTPNPLLARARTLHAWCVHSFPIPFHSYLDFSCWWCSLRRSSVPKPLYLFSFLRIRSQTVYIQRAHEHTPTGSWSESGVGSLSGCQSCFSQLSLPTHLHLLLLLPLCVHTPTLGLAHRMFRIVPGCTGKSWLNCWLSPSEREINTRWRATHSMMTAYPHAHYYQTTNPSFCPPICDFLMWVKPMWMVLLTTKPTHLPASPSSSSSVCAYPHAYSDQPLTHLGLTQHEPLDVLGRTRATLMHSASLSPWPRCPGNLL